MKKNQYLKDLMILLLLFPVFSVTSFAQPLSGNYTVGGLTPDYVSFAAAIGAIQNNGVSGPVIFNVRNGQYNEKVSMYQFAGSSVTNSVTFQSEDGDSALVILSDSSSTTNVNNFTLQIFGADHIIFHQITIERPGTNVNGTVIEIGNNSDDISLLNNRIMAGSGTAATIAKCLVYADASNQNTDIIISGNLMVNGNHGIYKLASQLETGNVITNNIFQNQNIGSIYVEKQDGINILRNSISVNGSTNYRAITHSQSVGCNTNKNKISVVTGNAGIYYLNCSPLSGFENTASNNFIHVAGTSVNSGILISNTQNIKIFHNSVNMTGTSATSNAFFSTGAANSGLQLKNNVFKHSGTGYAIRVSDTSAISVSDYNDFFTSGLNIGNYAGTIAALLSDWQTLSTQDSNSISVDPLFFSSSDLHSISLGINDQGTSLASIGTDIDGDPRNANNPDLGADEFTPMNDNVALTGVISPFSYSCGDSNTVITVVVQNLGLDTAFLIPVTIDISGTQALVLNDTIPGPLAPYSSDTLTITGTLNTYLGGNYNLNSYTSLPGDQDAFNDTILKTFTFIGYPDTPTVVSPQAFCEGNVNITGQTDSGNVIFWYDQAAGGNLLFSGNPFSPAITSDTVFYAEAHAGSGGSGCLRITEMGMNTPDHLEIQNCSAGPVDVTGWVVAISDNYTDINLENANLWDLTPLGIMAPGQIEYKTDGTVNPWGSNMFWAAGTANPGWSMIIDNAGVVVDFVVYAWADADIQAFNAIINNFPITLGTNWNGNGINPLCTATNALTRNGNADNDDLSDFVCTLATVGTQNTGLVLPFSSCGASACGSSRVPVTVNLFPLPVINLGSDTVSALPVTFDASPGFVSYLWNTTATTQTISVTTSGTYSVVVTDGNGCSATDSVLYTSTAGIHVISSINNLNIFPNPADEKLTIAINCQEPQNIQVSLYNCLGEIMITEERTLVNGMQSFIIQTGQCPPGVYNLEVRCKNGLINKKCTLQ